MTTTPVMKEKHVLKKQLSQKIIRLMTGLMAGVMACSAMAASEGGVSFSRNRIIFPASEKAVSLSVTNGGSGVYLVQAGVYGDQSKRTPAPFIVTPPLFRLDANSENSMRIIRAGEGLPTDRESVFYFNGLVIPSAKVPGADGGAKMSATLSVSMRSVMKLFWRPAGLKPAADKAPDALRFVRTAQGVRVINPTPYFQSFAQFSVDGKDVELDRIPSMVSPFGELEFQTKGAVHSVTWRVMNDYGGTTRAKTQSVEG
ncbi:molecular chaperone [Enterobacter cloacae]|nr:molecular chaperone [Enterobacter cloacae]